MEMETAKAGLEHVACPPLQFGKFYVSIWDSKPWEQFTSSKLSKLSSLDQSAIQNHEGMDTTVVCEVGLVLKQESHPKQKIAFQTEMGFCDACLSCFSFSKGAPLKKQREHSLQHTLAEEALSCDIDINSL